MPAFPPAARIGRTIRIGASAVALQPATAAACTLCYSRQAILVRERLCQDDLWWNGCAILLPLALLASIVALAAHEPRHRP